VAVAAMRVVRVGADPAARVRASGCPVGPLLLETLGDLNPEVATALARERARLRRAGYPADLPVPPLWWRPSARPTV
jgi:hypothetical protein